MRKLDNKGFTVVELTLSFIFVFTIAFSMYELLFNYRVRQNEESIKSQMMDYKNEVTLAIQNDINEKTLKNIIIENIDDFSLEILRSLFEEGILKCNIKIINFFFC